MLFGSPNKIILRTNSPLQISLSVDLNALVPNQFQAFSLTQASPIAGNEIITARVAGFLIRTAFTTWDRCAWSAKTVLHVFAFVAITLAIIVGHHPIIAVLAKVFALTPPAPRDIARFDALVAKRAHVSWIATQDTLAAPFLYLTRFARLATKWA